MKKISVFGGALFFLAAIFLMPRASTAMEPSELLSVIWRDAEIRQGTGWMPYSLNPNNLAGEEVTQRYDFSCSSGVCGALFANISIVPGRGNIWFEVTLFEGGTTVRSPWGRIPVRVVLKTSLGSLSPQDLMAISQVILTSREMVVRFRGEIPLSFAYAENPAGSSAPPLEAQITGWLEVAGADVR